MKFNPSQPGFGARAKKVLWDDRGTLGRAGIGAAGAYGGLTAASAPSTMAHNEIADFQEQSPIATWLGKTFMGMPEYRSRSYLMPGFMQGQ